MSSLNKVLLIGNLGRDPEIKHSNTGLAIANFSVATSKSWKDESGEKQEKTEWHSIVVFKKLAELAGQYLAKGSQVYVEGELQTRSWDDKETGVKKYRTEIVANSIQFLSPKPSIDRPAVLDLPSGPAPSLTYQAPVDEDSPF